MKIYDITVPLSERVPIYSGDPPFSVSAEKSIASGDAANVSQVSFGVHTGTHVDAPNHFIDGTRQSADLDLRKLIGRCTVVDIGDNAEIKPEHFPGTGVERVLFKTRNSAFWGDQDAGFRTDFTYLSVAAAREMANAGVVLVGIDYLSIEEFASEDFAAHKALLEREIVILEGLDLREVPAGDYELICLPLKYIGGRGDGAPARTILREIS